MALLLALLLAKPGATASTDHAPTPIFAGLAEAIV